MGRATALLFLCLPVLSAWAGWRVGRSYEIPRPPGAASLSGVTCVSNGVYWAATDWQPALWEMTLPLEPKTGRPQGCRLRRLCGLAGGVDNEDVAVDPLDRTRIWCADESVCRLTCRDAASGRTLAELDPGAALRRFRENTGLEALAISPDGEELWTTTEEAVEGDGPISTPTAGTCVRLTRFRRAHDGAWRPAGAWAYAVDPIGGRSLRQGAGGADAARSGVSGLCRFDDGTLLVLEREFSVKGIFPQFRCRIYVADLAGATDVSGRRSLKEETIVFASKRLLFERSGLSMYEGICEGPRLEDGSRTLVLVSDGDGPAIESVLVLRLKGD